MKRLAWQTVLFCVWSLCLSQLWPNPNESFPSSQSQLTTVEKSLRGQVVGLPKGGAKCSFTLSTENGLVRVGSSPSAFVLKPGQTVSVTGHDVPTKPPTNPGEFNFPLHLRSEGIRWDFQASDIHLTASPNWIHRSINTVHNFLDSALTHSVPASQAPLLRACLLGSTEGLDLELVEDFKASGMLHILAISGQHIGLIALIFLQIFSVIRIPRKAAYLITCVLLTLYVPVCGGSISVLRATIMFWCLLPGILCERPSLAMNNLAWTMLLCLISMPYQILSLGFQLSFAATFFLIAYSKTVSTLLSRFQIRNPITVYLVSTIVFSVILFLAAYPVLTTSVHTMAPSSLVGNIFTIALSSGMLVASCLSLLFHPIPFVHACFGETAGLFSQALSYCIHLFAHGPGAAESTVAFESVWNLILILILLALPYAAKMARARILILVGFTLFSGRWAWAQSMELWNDPTVISFLDVGQGDGCVLSLPSATLLIDAGPPPAGRNVILPYLRSIGVNRIDLVIVTHPDLDHYGGLAYLAEHIQIGKVLYPGIESAAQAWLNLQKTLKTKGIPMEVVHRGQCLYRYHETCMHVLSPQSVGQFPERNDNSVVTTLQLGKRRLLFTGDMEAPAQQFLKGHPFPELSHAILKVPHHGSDRSNPKEFLEWIHPSLAILSAGRKNRFGHPGPATVKTLLDIESRVFLTANQGAVLYQSNRKGENCRSFLKEPFRHFRPKL